MPSRKRGLFTDADSDNLDGDFKALIEVQKKRKEERAKGLAKGKDQGDGSHIKATEIIPLQQQNAEPKEDKEIASLYKDMFSAAESNEKDTFSGLLSRVDAKGLSLIDKEFRDPQNGETVLHRALLKDADEVVQYLLANGEVGLILADYEVIVRKVPSRKTCLHILAQKGHMDMVETLVRRLPNGDKKQKYLLQTVLTQIEGQRPRHLSAIHIAALHGHTELVQYLVSLGVDVNLVNNKQDTPVLWAARFNHIPTVRALIKLGANLQHQNDKGSTPLYWAVRYGLADMATLLIKEGKANIHQKRKLGLVSPIVLGAAMGYTDIVQLLLDAGADANLQIQGGNTPLHLAASQGHTDTIQVLLKWNADIDAENDVGDTPLLMAAAEYEIEAMELLAANCADLENKDKDGRGVWDHIIECADSTLLDRWVECYRRARRLAANKLIVPSGKTPLHIAAKIGDCDKINKLLDLGAEPAALDEAGNTFFHLAARENRTTVLESFMARVDINMQNSDGDTALHLAVRFGHNEAVSLLLKKMKINVTNSLGETALHVACKTRTVPGEIVEFLVDTIVKAHTWDLVDASDKKGNTALHAAARAGRSEVFGSLTHLNPRRQNRAGDTPLHVATRDGDVAVVEELIELFRQDLQLDSQNERGETALHLAAAGGNDVIVDVLVEAGASLEIQNKDGDTVLHALVVHSVTDPSRAQAFVAVFDTIVAKAARWWCMKRDLHLPDPESDLYQVLRRVALLKLISGIPNENGFSVMALAANVGAKGILQEALRIPDVFVKANEKEYIFDVTGLAPECMPKSATSKKEGVFRRMNPATVSVDAIVSKEDATGSQMSGKSCLDLIVTSPDIVVANEMLDIVPLKQLVSDFWTAYQWIYGVLMVVHMIFMACLSHIAIPLVSTSGTAPNLAFAAFLVWPGILLLFELYYFTNRFVRFMHKPDGLRKSLQWHGLSHAVVSILTFFMSYLAHFASVTFSVSMITWFVFYVSASSSQTHALAIALIVGWMFSIFFTQGFETVHAFTIMLKNIFIRDITRFFILYLFVLLAFSFAFQALFYPIPEVSAQFPSIWHIAFVTFNMMIGMGSFFEWDGFDNAHAIAGYSPTWVKFFYLIYIILTTIILLNLLIAMMTDSYAAVKAKEGTTWRVGSVRLALQIEKSMPFLPRMFKALQIKKNKISWDYETERWLMTVPRSHVEVKTSAASTEVMLSLNRLERELQEVRFMYSSMSEQLSMLLEQHPLESGRPGTARPMLKSRFSSTHLQQQSRRKGRTVMTDKITEGKTSNV